MKDRVKKSIILVSVGIIVNVILAIVKMYVGLSSNSLCIMLDAVNSFLDIITCIVTLIFFIVLLAPRSEKAPFGYGRGEYLSGFIVSVVAVVVGGLFFLRSINRLAMPEPVWFSWQNCVLISVTLPVKIGMGLMYYFANKKIKSTAIKAIMIDSFLDIGVTATSVVSFAISSNVDYAVDAIFGIVVSVFIVVVAIKMVVDNVKAIVVGDGAQDEKNAISAACDDLGVTIDRIVLHDYGFGAKVGDVFVRYDGKDVSKELHDKVMAATNADVTFIRIEDDAQSDGNANENDLNACAVDSENRD